jgi:hypothetical protein
LRRGLAENVHYVVVSRQTPRRAGVPRAGARSCCTRRASRPAADAGINHLTAVRVYRRLAELGYVGAAVGRGTFVRRNVPAAGTTSEPSWSSIGFGWQL